MDWLVEERLKNIREPSRRVGATYVERDGVYVRLWAPYAKKTFVAWNEGEKEMLAKQERGYFSGHFPDKKPGDRYVFFLDDAVDPLPDPASRFQPDGVFGPSEVIGNDFEWTDNAWKGIPFDEWVIYELHTGTFSERHNFKGIVDDLPRLRDLGITTLEIMPVSQFPGERNWGYDGVFPHAVQNSYGGPCGLKQLVNACHEYGLAVILDVVYNHMGPEGNVAYQCGPYENEKYNTPWAHAINFDEAGSEEVRQYFLQSAWQFLTEYHFDGLRLDAIQFVFDMAPIPFLEEVSRLKEAAEEHVGRPLVLIGETDQNDPRVLAHVDSFGYGFDAQWVDDLHHTVHSTLTGEHDGYYEDFGGIEQLARIYRNGLAYQGDYSPYLERRHGRPYGDVDMKRLVVEIQNHDQIGNRAQGERLSSLVDFEKLKLAAACYLLSPFTPLLFMGEELAETAPFLYFINHDDPGLMKDIRKGRRKDFKRFNWEERPPDPGLPETFRRSLLTDDSRDNAKAQTMQSYYKELIGLSRELRTMAHEVTLEQAEERIILEYNGAGKRITVILSFSANAGAFDIGEKAVCVLQSALYKIGEPKPPYIEVSKKVEIAPFSATVVRALWDE